MARTPKIRQHEIRRKRVHERRRRRRPPIIGKGASIGQHELNFAINVMESGGWDLMSLMDCVSCGQLVHGGGGGLSSCFKCRDFIGGGML